VASLSSSARFDFSISIRIACEGYGRFWLGVRVLSFPWGKDLFDLFEVIDIVAGDQLR
jgi:hypothetical protein